MPTPQKRPVAKMSIKEQRAQKRAAEIEAFKTREAAARRNRLLGIIGGILAVVLVGGGVALALYYGSLEQEAEANAPVPVQTVDPALLQGSYEDRVQVFPGLDGTHTTSEVSYPQTPPVGGPHNPAWLNCGVYSKEQPNVNAVHTLEHGAVWITYDPNYIDQSKVDALIALAPPTYTLISPYRGLGEVMAISAWGAQLRFTDVDDPAVIQFIDRYWRAADGPEPGAPCTGGITGDGLVG